MSQCAETGKTCRSSLVSKTIAKSHGPLGGCLHCSPAYPPSSVICLLTAKKLKRKPRQSASSRNNRVGKTAGGSAAPEFSPKCLYASFLRLLPERARA